MCHEGLLFSSLEPPATGGGRGGGRGEGAVERVNPSDYNKKNSWAHFLSVKEWTHLHPCSAHATDVLVDEAGLEDNILGQLPPLPAVRHCALDPEWHQGVAHEFLEAGFWPAMGRPVVFPFFEELMSMFVASMKNRFCPRWINWCELTLCPLRTLCLLNPTDARLAYTEWRVLLSLSFLSDHWGPYDKSDDSTVQHSNSPAINNLTWLYSNVSTFRLNR